MTQPQSSGRLWVLQIRPGELRLVRDFSEVIRFILERRVDRNALVYEVAGEARVLGDIPELANLFGNERPLHPSEEAPSLFNEARPLTPSEEVPYLDSISPLGATESAFADDFYDVPVQRRVPRLVSWGLGLAALAGGGLWAVRHWGPPSSDSLFTSLTAPRSPSASLPAATPPAATTPAPAAIPVAPAAPASTQVAADPAPASAPATSAPIAAAPVAAPAPAAVPAPVAAAAPAPAPSPAAAASSESAAAKSAPTTPARRPIAHAAPKEVAHAAPKEVAHAAPKEVAHVKEAAHAAPKEVAHVTTKPVHDDPLTAPHSYDELVREGDRQMATGHAKRATQLFEQASALDPDGAGALNGMAYSWLDRGDAQKAIPLFQRAFWKDAHLSPALFGLGEAYRALGRRKEALDAFRVYLMRFPGGRDAKAARRQIDQLGHEMGPTASG